MDGATLLIRASIHGFAITGNPTRASSGTRAAYRERIHRALKNAPFARPVPTEGPVAVRILVTRHPNAFGDADNIAKPILDALEPVLGTTAGRVRDCRVHHLEVVINETRQAPPRVMVELHLIDDHPARRTPIRSSESRNGRPTQGISVLRRSPNPAGGAPAR